MPLDELLSAPLMDTSELRQDTGLQNAKLRQGLGGKAQASLSSEKMAKAEFVRRQTWTQQQAAAVSTANQAAVDHRCCRPGFSRNLIHHGPAWEGASR